MLVLLIFSLRFTRRRDMRNSRRRFGLLRKHGPLAQRGGVQKQSIVSVSRFCFIRATEQSFC
ncbi:hypothetical protein KCP78_05835 [Salmonella enterica subsp. enterica]|nr:hypothetical protein KCP78_05835 [Salmonella enterica subsp. enterica]